MSRYNSNSRPEMEECQVISATNLYQEETIRRGNGDLHLDYQVQEHQVSYSIEIEWTECNFGGFRPWFRCPGMVDGYACNQRVEKLYRPPRNTHFLCRHCHNITYRSSNVSGNLWKEAGHKMQRIRENLKKKSKREDYDPTSLRKPKGMHWSTFMELMKDYYKFEEIFYFGVQRKTKI